MKQKAIILGATGLVGSHLLQELLQDDDFSQVIHFGRRSVGFHHDKLQEHIINLFELEQYKEHFKADMVFCCIGTTASKTKDYSTYSKIDKGIAVSAANLCVENAIPKFIVISSLGANANSVFDYPRIKGEMQDEVLKKQIEKIYILQPSIIGGKREESRPAESFGKFVLAIVDPILIGGLRKYKLIEPEDIANAMMVLATQTYAHQIISSHQIQMLADRYK